MFEGNSKALKFIQDGHLYVIELSFNAARAQFVHWEEEPEHKDATVAATDRDFQSLRDKNRLTLYFVRSTDEMSNTIQFLKNQLKVESGNRPFAEYINVKNNRYK